MIEQYLNKRFGKLVVTACYPKGRGGRFDVLCDCGTKRNVFASEVLLGQMKSCGCLRQFESHGEAGRKEKTREYKAWENMLSRCRGNVEWNNHYYRKRGITVCDEWQQSFLAFLRDVGRKPSPNMSLERIDNDKGYFHGNVMWATRTEQMLNTRIKNGNTSGVKGVFWSNERKLWCATIYLNGMVKQLGRFKTKEEAIQARMEAENKYYKPIEMEKFKRLKQSAR